MFLIFALKNKWSGKMLIQCTPKDLPYGMSKLQQLPRIFKTHPNYEFIELEKNVPKSKLQETLCYWKNRYNSKYMNNSYM